MDPATGRSDAIDLRALRLVCVTPGDGDFDAIRRLSDTVLAGGATGIWIRERTLSDDRLAELVAHVRDVGGAAIVSGRVVHGAAAVHLGVPDSRPDAVPRTSGVAVGFSAHDPLDADAVGASDYVTLSPLFATPAKDHTAPRRPLGLDRFGALARSAGRPVVALGGIDASNVGMAIGAGAVGVAVLRALSAASDPRAAAQALRSAVDDALRGDA